jgi:hypothetical protein
LQPSSTAVSGNPWTPCVTKFTLMNFGLAVRRRGKSGYDDGFLAQILIPAGTSDVPVGTPMLVLCTSAADVPAFANFKADGAAAAPAKAAAPSPAKAAPAAAPTPAPTVAAAAPPPPRAAAAAPTSLAGVALPALGGKIYYNPTNGESCTPWMPRACARTHPSARGAPGHALLNPFLTTCV